ncbi:MAG: Pvc16 family protein [Roseovarius sp.]
MIDQILNVVQRRLGQHLRAVYTLEDTPLVLSPLVHADRTEVEETRCKLALFLVNIAPQAMPHKVTGDALHAPATLRAEPAPLQLELHVMVACGHGADTYAGGLRMLSTAIIALHADTVLTPQNTPDLPAGVDQVSLEMIELSATDLAQVWQSIGRPYAPSALYRVRTQLVGPGYVAPAQTPI